VLSQVSILLGGGYHIQYKKVVVPGKDEINLASNAATWQK
jgi:hypothetical protein